MRDALRKARDAKRQRRGQVEPVQNLILYDYQQEMTDKILDAFDAGKERVYGQSPTGSGKTTMMMYIIDKLWRRGNGAQIAAADKERGQVLILVPSIQIASQIQQEAVIILRGQLKHRCRIELEQGESHTDGDADLTVATWQGLHRSDERIINFDPMFFELVIVDECHHAASPCFLRVSQYFHEDVTLEPETTPIDGDRNGHRVKLLGLSATTQRTDGYSVENAFPHYAHEVDMERLMLEKKLTKVLYAAVDGELDIKELLEGGEGDEEENDFDENDDDPFRRCNNRIVKQHILRQSEGGRKYTLVFCKRLKQVWSLKAAFRRKGILAEGITGKTPVNVRGKLLKDFRSGRYPCLINCSTLVEGTDLPCIDLLIIAKPTKSEIQFTQMLGRGLRNSHQTKKLNCLVLDFTVSETTGMQMFGKLFALVTQVDSWPKRRKVVSEEKDNETKSKRDVSQIAPEKKEETSQDFVVAQRKRVHADRDRKRANDGSLIIQPWAHRTTPVSEEPTDLDTGSESDNSVISLPLRCQYGSPGPVAGIIRRIAYYNDKAQEDAADASSAEDVDNNISVKRKDRRLKEESSSFGSMGTIGEVTEAVAWGQESDEEW